LFVEKIKMKRSHLGTSVLVGEHGTNDHFTKRRTVKLPLQTLVTRFLNIGLMKGENRRILYHVVAFAQSHTTISHPWTYTIKSESDDEQN
jgi:hypothetical protein